MKPYNFSFTNKILFYSRYFFGKLFILWFQVKTPKVKVFLFEFIYSFGKLIKIESLRNKLPRDIDYIETKFGKFKLRPGTEDAICASPAFEQPDIDYLLQLINQSVKEGKKILFTDIGADFGAYSVTVGNRFTSYKNISIVAFESSPERFQLVQDNLELNNLETKAIAVNRALSDIDGQALTLNFNQFSPGGSSARIEKSHRDAVGIEVKTTTFDAYFKESIHMYDTIFLKIDVEGFENNVFDGGHILFEGSKDIYILVEDCVDASIIEYLQTKGAIFIDKFTPYNSFWKISSK